TIQISLPEGALFLDAIRKLRVENNIPVYLEDCLLSTAQSLVRSSEIAIANQECQRVDKELFETLTIPTITKQNEQQEERDKEKEKAENGKENSNNSLESTTLGQSSPSPNPEKVISTDSDNKDNKN